jgi:DNA-directed RNA polymerase specialized sigma subunit
MKKYLKLKTRDLNEALENIDYKKIMDSVCAKYCKSVDPDDISSLRLEVLWKCLNSFDETRGVKFTTFLYQQLNYAMMNQLRIRRREKNGIPFDICHTPKENIEVLLSDLNEDQKKILKQRYLDRMTMVEIGEKNGYSRETARRAVNSALAIFEDND